MSSASYTSHDLRLLICLRCGAPFETAPSGGHHTCAYCGSTHALAPRDERPATFARPDEALGSEAERFAALRAQMFGMHAYDFPPAPLRSLARDATNVARIPEVERLFREAEARVLAGSGPDDEIALSWITGVLRTMYIVKGEHRLARAVDETALETLTDPVLRTVQRASLANRACDAWDLDAAEAWIAPCPRESDVLTVHTHVRLAEARIALMRGRYDVVLERLGAKAEDVPLRIDRDAMACLYRADAYERMGDLARAAEALDASARNLGGKIYALVKITDLKDAWPGFPLCAQTYPGFRTRFLRRRAVHVLVLTALAVSTTGCAVFLAFGP